MEHVDQNDELKDAPHLRAVPKNYPFEVPEGFFNNFPHQVQGLVQQQRPMYGWPLAFRPVLAGSILLMVGISFMLWQRSVNRTEPLIVTELTQLDDDPLLEGSLLWVDEQDLYGHLASSEQLLPQPGEGFTHEELGVYLEYAELPLTLLAERP